MTEHKFDNLIKYIDYFEDVAIKYYTWEPSGNLSGYTYPTAYLVYDDMFKSFIKAVYDCDIMLQDYIERISEVIYSLSEYINYPKGRKVVLTVSK